jgi:hypothetical protein
VVRRIIKWRTHWNKCFWVTPEDILIVLISIAISLLFVIPALLSTTASANDVNITPRLRIIPETHTTIVSVYCTPSEPIKAFEFKIEFDPDLIQANFITEGTFFDGYNTFFNPGIINNSAGRITDIYSLIIGPGLVNSPGSFVTISFTSKDQSGVSAIHLYDLGITNNTQYLSVEKTDGRVQVYGEFYPWDVNEDTITNYLDLSSIVSHYSQSGTVGWIPADVIMDGIVNYIDISATISHYE